jgi:predicted naringenin-chalcone synthase
MAGVSASQLDCILVASCTGYLCPDLSTLLVAHLGLRADIQRGALLGHGCAGALPLLQRAHDYACAHPGQRVLAIAVEICSAAYYIDNSMETVIGNVICADGAAAVLLCCSPRLAQPRRLRAPSPPVVAAPPVLSRAEPQILAFQSVLDPSQLDKVGFEQRDGKLRIILAAQIRDLAGPIIERCLQRLLARSGLRKEDIRFWLLHPGGRKVLDQAAEYLGLSEQQLRFSRRVLRNFGNMSSPTVLFVLSEVMRSAQPSPGDYGVLLALGPGFAAEAALLRW